MAELMEVMKIDGVKKGEKKTPNIQFDALGQCTNALRILCILPRGIERECACECECERTSNIWRETNFQWFRNELNRLLHISCQ